MDILKTQLYLFEPFSGIVSDVDYFKLNRKGISIQVGRKTKIGNVKLTSGGINFLRLSDFTLSSARQVRNSLFDRNAWTNVWSINTQYENYYKESDYERIQWISFDFEMPTIQWISAIRIKKDYGLNFQTDHYKRTSFLQQVKCRSNLEWK